MTFVFPEGISVADAMAHMQRLQEEIVPGSRKENILTAAETIFAEHGYEGAPISEIARTAGVSKSGLLHHFPSKEALLVAVLERVDLQEAGEIGMSDLPGAIEMLQGQVALLRRNMANRELMRFTILMACEGTSVDHPAHPWARQRYAFSEWLFAEAFRRDVAHGRISLACEPIVAARQLLAVMDGLKLQWLLNPDDVDPAAIFEQYVMDWLAARR